MNIKHPCDNEEGGSEANGIESRKASQRKYYDANSLKLKVYRDQTRDKKKDYNRYYNYSHCDEKKKLNKNYYETHRDDKQAVAKKYSETHRDKKKEYNRTYYEAHTEEMKKIFQKLFH